jgi:hypothetical protein
LIPARVSMLLKSCESPNVLPFSLCNKKMYAFRHKNRPVFPTTLFIPSYHIGKQILLRIYQHPLVKIHKITIRIHNITIKQIIDKIKQKHSKHTNIHKMM